VRTRKLDNRNGDCRWPWLKARRKFCGRQQEKFCAPPHGAGAPARLRLPRTSIISRRTGRNGRVSLQSRPAVLGSPNDERGKQTSETTRVREWSRHCIERDDCRTSAGRYCHRSLGATVGACGFKLCLGFHVQRGEPVGNPVWCRHDRTCRSGVGQSCSSTARHFQRRPCVAAEARRAAAVAPAARQSRCLFSPAENRPCVVAQPKPARNPLVGPREAGEL
jgi:hypothetical protein